MENYSLSSSAQNDLVGIYKFGIKYFGIDQAVKYQHELENVFEELSKFPEIARDATTIANGLKFFRYKAHYIFYQFEEDYRIYVVRVLGKRMNFVEHF